MIALCDIGGVWPVMRVTAALTDIAVNSVQSALRYLFRQEVARGRMSAAGPGHPEAAPQSRRHAESFVERGKHECRGMRIQCCDLAVGQSASKHQAGRCFARIVLKELPKS